MKIGFNSTDQDGRHLYHGGDYRQHDHASGLPELDQLSETGASDPSLPLDSSGLAPSRAPLPCQVIPISCNLELREGFGPDLRLNTNTKS
jgi:hypothetical protein